MDSLTLRALTRTASGKGGESNIETKATTKAWHEGLEMLRLFKYILFYAVIDEDEDNNWWCYGGPFRFETAWQGRRPRLITVIIIPGTAAPAVLVKELE